MECMHDIRQFRAEHKIHDHFRKKFPIYPLTFDKRLQNLYCGNFFPSIIIVIKAIPYFFFQGNYRPTDRKIMRSHTHTIVIPRLKLTEKNSGKLTIQTKRGREEQRGGKKLKRRGLSGGATSSLVTVKTKRENNQ